MREADVKANRRRRAAAALAAALCALTLLAGASARQGEVGEGKPVCEKGPCFEVNHVAACEGDNCLEAVAAEGCDEPPCFALKQVEKCEGESCFRVFRLLPKPPAKFSGGYRTKLEPQPRRAALQSVEKAVECKTAGTCFEMKQVKGCKVQPCFKAVKKETCEGDGCFALKKL
jgi:hypothetical protein